MNNQFNYDREGTPSVKIQTCRKFGDKYLINGRVYDNLNHLTPEQKEQAKAILGLHTALTSKEITFEQRKNLLKKYKDSKK